MGNLHLFSRIGIAFAILFALILVAPQTDQTLSVEHFTVPEGTPYVKPPKRDRMDLAMAQEVEMTKDPATGNVPTERLLEAQRYARELRSTMRAPLPGVNWTERGPSNVSGRTRAIMVDPNDPSGHTIWAGGVAGGLWRTTDITQSAPNWAPVDEFFDNLAITTLAYDPSNTQIFYFGTGEGYYNGDAVRGLGIWKTTNGGTTWNQLPATNNSTYFYIQRIAVTASGTVLAATRSGGIRRSVDGGASWTKVLGNGMGITGANSNVAWDVRVAANGDIYASLDGSLHKSTNDGATFGAALNIGVPADRIDIAVAPGDANYLYALVENGNQVQAILRSTNAGATFQSRNEPNDDDPGIGANDFSRGQAWYDLSIAVDPNNRDRLFVGGVDLFGSVDGGNSWTQIAHWYGGFGHQYVHADQHQVLFEPGNSDVVYFTNDGGVYRSENATNAVPTIEFKSDNYNVTQFYACAIHPGAQIDYFLAGAQDNGTQQFTTGGMNATVEATGGDGAFTHIDQNQPQYQFTSYVYNNFRRSNNGGASFVNVNAGNSGRFINPSDFDDDANIMYSARNNNQFLRWNNPHTGNSFTTENMAVFGGQVSAVKVSPNTANRVFFGTSNGNIIRVNDAATSPLGTRIESGSMPNAYVSSITVETGNDNHLIVTFSNYGVNSIWETLDGGTNWTSIEGNLPDMPIRDVLLNPSDNRQAIIATQLGVWSTDLINGGSTNWGPSNSGLANVRVDQFKMRSSDNLVIAATHGRGLFSSDVFTSPTALFDSDRHVIYTGKTIQFSDHSYKSTSWEWDFGDGSPVDNSQNPSHTYFLPGKYTVSLTINGGVSNATKVSFIHVLPDRGTPYAPGDGGNFEVNIDDFGPENWAGTPWERGSSAIAGKNGTRSGANAWVTDLGASDYADQSRAELFVPSFNMTAAGTYTLDFWARFHTETNWDGFRLEYSLDKGDNWAILGTVGANWYNYANNAQNTAFPINEPYFTGNQGGAYQQYTQDISFLQGNPNVQFRFVFRTDQAVTEPGVAIDDFSITGPPNGPSGLPVEGSPLTGTWKEDGVHLLWDTYSEVNNMGFEIQRSYDGTGFEAIGFREGAGDAQDVQAYNWLDPQPGGAKVYYRYRQVDFNGAFAYSNVVELNRPEGLGALSMQVFPNPFDAVVNLRLNQPVTAATVRLVDMRGSVVYHGNLEGMHAQIRPQSALASGVYFLELRVGTAVDRKKLLKR